MYAKIMPMIKNLQDELYTLQSKQAKGAKIRANIKWNLGVIQKVRSLETSSFWPPLPHLIRSCSFYM